MMIYHVINTSIYAKRYLELLIDCKQAIDLDKHLFFIIRNNKKLFEPEIIDEINFKDLNRDQELFRYLLNVRKFDKLIIHGLFYPRLLLLMYLFPGIARKSTWSIWGGDAYFHQYKEDTMSYRLNIYLRKKVIPSIPLITCNVKGDYEVVREMYQTRAAYLYSIYPVDTSIINKEPEEVKIPSDDDSLKVMLGNSADSSNNHLEILDYLKSYKDENIRLIVPLSYGGSQDYIDKIINYGKLVFRNKFYPLTEFLPPSKYNEILTSIDILVLNHGRQQGQGNIFPLLALKKKVYMRSTVTTFNYLKNLGIKVWDTLKLPEEDFVRFSAMDKKTGDRNSRIIKEELAEANLIRLWNNVFNHPDF